MVGRDQLGQQPAGASAGFAEASSQGLQCVQGARGRVALVAQPDAAALDVGVIVEPGVALEARALLAQVVPKAGEVCPIARTRRDDVCRPRGDRPQMCRERVTGRMRKRR